MKEVENILFTIGACVSSICVIALMTVCCVIPKWCNLVNYVSVHQIIFGTFQLICVSLRYFMGPNIQVDLNILDYYFLLMSVCWSFCAASISYWRLVEVKRQQQQRHEKRIATAFSYGMFLFVIAFDAVIPSIIEINEIINNHQILKMIPVFMMLAINVIIFLCIISVLAFCYTPPLSVMYDNGKLRALIGFALSCDIIAFGYLVAMFLCIFNHKDYMWMYDMYLFATVIYCSRMALHTTHLLTNRFTYERYKSFIINKRAREREIVIHVN